MSDPITYSLIEYRGTSRIAIYFDFNVAWNKRMMTVPDAKWSKSLHCWHIPDTPENRKRCGLSKTGIAVPVSQVTTPVIMQGVQAPKAGLSFLSENNKDQLQKFLQQILLKAYSPSTMRTYRNEFTQLLQLLGAIVRNWNRYHFLFKKH